MRKRKRMKRRRRISLYAWRRRKKKRRIKMIKEGEAGRDDGGKRGRELVMVTVVLMVMKNSSAKS